MRFAASESGLDWAKYLVSLFFFGVCGKARVNKHASRLPDAASGQNARKT
jgi:hypothetical protein